MSEEQLNRIEETLIHQQQEIDSLNAVVTRQWEVIDRLTKRLEKVQEEMETMSFDGDGGGPPANEKPPHY